MTRAFVDARETSTDISAATSARGLYRAAGWGGIGAFFAWVGQPVVVAVSAATLGDDYPDWDAAVGDRAWAGSVEAVIFLGVGVGMLFFVLATVALVHRAGGLRSTASRVGAALGVCGALAWVFVAGSEMAQFTSVGAGIPEVAPEAPLQAALMQTLSVALTGFLVAASFGMAGFTVFLSTAARRAGVIGWPLTALTILFLLMFASAFFMPLSPPWGMIGFVLMGLIFGIAFLAKSRKA